MIKYNLFLYFYHVILLAVLRGHPSGTGPSLPPPILDKGREGFLLMGMLRYEEHRPGALLTPSHEAVSAGTEW